MSIGAGAGAATGSANAALAAGSAHRAALGAGITLLAGERREVQFFERRG